MIFGKKFIDERILTTILKYTKIIEKIMRRL